MRFFFLSVGLLALTACASVEGPGSLGRVGASSPATTQPPVAQTAPLPAPVSSQALNTPGQAAPSLYSNQIGAEGAESIFASPGQPSGDPLVSPQVNAGVSSQSSGLTLEDFSSIDPRLVPENDPFADEREAQTLNTLGANTFGDGTQRSMEDSVEQSLTGQATPGLLQPARPQYPRASLAPISSAPEPQSTQLFDALDDVMFEGGMQLAFFGDDTAQFVVRSQLSAIPSDTSTQVLYTFDVFDARGTLRHRVVGSLAVPQSGPNGWDFVNPAAITTIARDVGGQLLPWFRLNPQG
ncbi:MAG: hypothetical protein AAF739_03640 [Pseudomonadota bacterium]